MWKIDLNHKFKTFEGEDVKDPFDKTITLKRACIMALNLQDPRIPIDEMEKLRRGLFSERIFKADSPFDLTPEEIVLLKKLISKHPLITPHICLQAFRLLDPDFKKTEDKLK